MEPEDSRDFQEIIGDPKMSQMWDQQSLRESRKKSRESIPNLFVAGGIVRTASSECEAYNPNTGEWTRIPPMREERNACGAAAVGNLLYVIGGANKVSDLPSGECYSPLFNNWHDITPMNHGRRNFGICSNNDTIYLMGGMTGEQCLQSAIKFNTVLGAWHSCPTLREALNPCRTVALNNVLYAFGGFKCPSVEKWDLRTPAWVMLAGQPKVIEWYGVAAIDYVLYCIARDEQELRRYELSVRDRSLRPAELCRGHSRRLRSGE
ncbi:UNVERIFIED_CONTAM: hypothetical protein PYX00_001634 [Menopon gallinae]|uniref:Uncharacterized protein n=1 Tax=Menopon gallinae TaxID=328185 RepID=A0AAW2IDE1_9NEOP